MTAPVAPGRGAYTSPECEQSEHQLCPGNQEIRLHADEVPVQVLRCDCHAPACRHRQPQQA